MLVDELARAKQREQVAAWDRAETTLREQLGLDVPKRELSVDLRDRFGLFEKWCGEKGVRRLPAKPWVVAAFLLDQIACGRDVQGCLALLAAIEAAHDSHSLSNPTATAVVTAALDQIIKSEPPRGWPKEGRVQWAKLPPDIRLAISKHEDQRDRALRQAQNKLANERRALAAESALSERNIEHVTASQV